ncbi:MAG: hypothetical protein ACR2HR_07575, partial [Euzebya sp.]
MRRGNGVQIKVDGGVVDQDPAAQDPEVGDWLLADWEQLFLDVPDPVEIRGLVSVGGWEPDVGLASAGESVPDGAAVSDGGV